VYVCGFTREDHGFRVARVKINHVAFVLSGPRLIWPKDVMCCSDSPASSRSLALSLSLFSFSLFPLSLSLCLSVSLTRSSLSSPVCCPLWPLPTSPPVTRTLRIDSSNSNKSLPSCSQVCTYAREDRGMAVVFPILLVWSCHFYIRVSLHFNSLPAGDFWGDFQSLSLQ
jgi:hypothetical protein